MQTKPTSLIKRIAPKPDQEKLEEPASVLEDGGHIMENSRNPLEVLRVCARVS
jgi:hypothetical protein